MNKAQMKWLFFPLLICAFLFPLIVKADVLSGCATADKSCYLKEIEKNNQDTTDGRYWIGLQVAIPVPNCDKIEGMLCIGNMLVGVKSLGEMIIALFQFFSIMIAIFLSVMLVIGGIMYIAARGSSDYISKAKGIIKNSALSLLVVMFSVLLLYQLNPKLIEPSFIDIATIKKIECCKTQGGNGYYFAPFNDIDQVYKCAEGDTSAPDNMCLTAELDLGGEQASQAGARPTGNLVEMKSTKNILVTATEGKYVSTEIWTELAEIANEMNAKGFDGIVVSSGARTVEQQNNLSLTNAAACKIKDGKKESCPHTSGVAVDVWGMKNGAQCVFKSAGAGKINCWGTDEASSTAGIKRCLQDPCQRSLVDTMLNRGYCVLLGSNSPRYREVWHFEKANPPLSSGCVYKIPEKYLSTSLYDGGLVTNLKISSILDDFEWGYDH